jgi:hypothetical protein
MRVLRGFFPRFRVYEARDPRCCLARIWQTPAPLPATPVPQSLERRRTDARVCSSCTAFPRPPPARGSGVAPQAAGAAARRPPARLRPRCLSASRSGVRTCAHSSRHARLCNTPSCRFLPFGPR